MHKPALKGLNHSNHVTMLILCQLSFNTSPKDFIKFIKSNTSIKSEITYRKSEKRKAFSIN